jgi:hypothetical protein
VSFKFDDFQVSEKFTDATKETHYFHLLAERLSQATKQQSALFLDGLTFFSILMMEA